MKRELKLMLLSSVIACTSFAQAPVIIAGELRLPADSVARQQFVADLNKFWRLKDTLDIANPLIDKDHFLATSALLDEVRGIEASRQYKDAHFYKPYLTNVAALANGTYVVQIAITGVADGQPKNRAAFTFRAHKKADGFQFYSPLQANTSAWRTTVDGPFSIHHKTTVLSPSVLTWAKKAAAFDKKLGAGKQQTELYIAGDFPDALRVIGVDYKIDYNGYSYNTLSARGVGKMLIVDGMQDFSKADPHDLWHDRLHNVYPAATVNKPVDEGCAYLYGGSWGISWTEILKSFKQKVVKPDADYLSLYESDHDFGETPQKRLIAGYVMNALLVQKLEKEQGFGAVIALLKCGPKEKDNANYFKVLERLTGINRSNFNQRIAELINKA